MQNKARDGVNILAAVLFTEGEMRITELESSGADFNTVAPWPTVRM